MTRWWRLPGRAPYAEVHALQRRLVDARAAGAAPDTVLFVEHEETITLGRARGADASVLDAAGVPVIAVERGGDATWHGPGQLVAYPIVGLDGPRRDMHRHLHALEDAIIAWLTEDFGLAAQRDPRNTGVWLPCPDGERRKVASIGIACRKWVTWHGLAVNLTPDLARIAAIRPCGFDATIMTRLADHVPRAPTIDEAAAALAPRLAATLGIALGPVEDPGVGA